MQTIAVLMTCHNRRDKTLSCLGALFANTLPVGSTLNVYLVDDGSTDDTSTAVLDKYPEVKIIYGDGSLYWNRGMYIAFEQAMKVGFDFYLWLNDDTFLYPHAISVMLATATHSSPIDAIAVGAVCDPDTKEFTYGGAKHIGGKFRPFLCEYVKPIGVIQNVDVMNGNVVLIPNSIAIQLGNLNPTFEHAMGDTEYAMRAREIGIEIFLTSHYIGNCSINSISGTHEDTSISLGARYKWLFSRKGLPLRSWFTLCRLHGGAIWPVQFVWGYVRLFVSNK